MRLPKTPVPSAPPGSTTSDPKNMKVDNAEVVVIGGGIIGLATAYYGESGIPDEGVMKSALIPSFVLPKAYLERLLLGKNKRNRDGYPGNSTPPCLPSNLPIGQIWKVLRGK